MANLKSSKKHAEVSEKRRKLNASKKSIVKNCVKKVYLSIKSGDYKIALQSFFKMQSIVDKYAVKGIIHKNKSARYKSNLYSKIKKMIV